MRGGEGGSEQGAAGQGGQDRHTLPLVMFTKIGSKVGRGSYTSRRTLATRSRTASNPTVFWSLLTSTCKTPPAEGEVEA